MRASILSAMSSIVQSVALTPAAIAGVMRTRRAGPHAAFSPSGVSCPASTARRPGERKSGAPVGGCGGGHSGGLVRHPALTKRPTHAIQPIICPINWLQIMPAEPSDPAARSPATRAAVSNGSRRFSAADGRSAGARLIRDREHELAESLGGLAGLTPADRLRVQSAALLSCRLEELRSASARGDAATTDEDLVRIGNAVARALAALERLATARRAKPAGSALAAYLDAKAEATA